MKKRVIGVVFTILVVLSFFSIEDSNVYAKDEMTGMKVEKNVSDREVTIASLDSGQHVTHTEAVASTSKMWKMAREFKAEGTEKTTSPVVETSAPVHVDRSKPISIMGESVVPAEKLAAFVKARNPRAQHIDEIAELFIEIGQKYGIRGDIAFVQAVLETGWFKYDGGTAVTPDQHNYGGLGVVRKGVKGHAFPTVKAGVTANIQHLFAYASTKPLPAGETLIDPRFSLVSPRGKAPYWQDLSGTWAADRSYGTKILSLYEQLKND